MTSNSQLAHIWAQQTKERGKTSNGNFSFEGRFLFSYRTEIARFINGKVVSTRHSYSVTTNGKHMNQIYKAVNHLEWYRVNREMRDLPDHWEDVALIIFEDMLINLKSAIIVLSRARTSIEYRSRGIAELAHDAHRFYASYIYDLNFSDQFTQPQDNRITLGDLIALCSIATPIEDVIRDRFGADIAEKAKKEREANAIRRAEFKAQEERRIREDQEKIAKWLSGDRSVYPAHYWPLSLRVLGDTIETTRGAIVPLESALKLWHAIQSGISLKGFIVGEFQVTEITADEIKIGCHTIPLEEIQRIARALQLAGESLTH